MKRRRWSRASWLAPLAAIVAIGIIVALAFYVRGFQGTSNDPAALPTDTGAPGAPHSNGSSGHKHRHPDKNAHGTKVVVPSGGPTVTLGGAGGPGLAIAGPHTMVAHVESSEPISVIGYLSPTSPDLTYGTAKNVGTSWTVHTTVSGRPKYAILWIYGAQDGARVTCSITIDGTVVDRKSTKGPYGRQICLG
jgi:hypothetical protein